MNNKNFKRFDIKNQEEALVILGSLISVVKVNLDKYSTYRNELEHLVVKYEPLNDDKEVLIPAEEYENINDKLLYRQREMLKFCADQQKDSFSYIGIRHNFVKREFLKTKLDSNVSAVLNHFLDIRNCTFHNTQSIYTAYKEVTDKELPDDMKESITVVPQINPIVINKVESYDYLFILSSLAHADRMKNDFTLILRVMTSDYEEMYRGLGEHQIFIPGGDSILFFEKKLVKRLKSPLSDCVQLAMAIQKAKYDGSQASFDEVAIFSSKNNKL